MSRALGATKASTAPVAVFMRVPATQTVRALVRAPPSSFTRQAREHPPHHRAMIHLPRLVFRAARASAFIAFLIAANIIQAASTPAAKPLPRDWIDPDTGHRIIRLSPDEGGSSLYFHQRSYTPEGDKIIIHTRAPSRAEAASSSDASAAGSVSKSSSDSNRRPPSGHLATIDLTTLGASSPSTPKLEIIAPNTRAFATAWRTREAYVVRRGEAGASSKLVAIHLDTKATRDVVTLPPEARGGQFAINCDESLLIGIGPDPDGKTIPRTPPPNGMGGTLETNWAAGTPKMIYTVDLKSGAFRVLHRENDWTNHLQCSPTDPLQILFCHEGPWHFNERTWIIRADGTPAKSVHQRTMNMEIWGHEFFSQDGKTVWYDLQTPRSTVFWLAGYEIATGQRTWYHLERREWSVHYNISPDGSVFAGDGGYPGSVAARGPNGETIAPPAQGQWIYLFRPAMVRGNSPREPGRELIATGFLKSEKLVNMARHDYSKTTGVEPNLTFTPDGKWIIFSGNFHSPRDERGRAITHVYAVELVKSQKKT